VTELTAPSRSVASLRIEDMVGFIQDASLVLTRDTSTKKKKKKQVRLN
jgi:hypothetical protein